MELKQKIQAFAALGDQLEKYINGEARDAIQQRLNEKVQHAYVLNNWFTEANVRTALRNIGAMLSEDQLNQWLRSYKNELPAPVPQKVGVVMAGNIPLVGFHDFISILMAGHHFKGKLSSRDKILLPALAEMLVEIEPAFEGRIHFTEDQLEDIDAVIATGSNNSARYFEYYFGKYPNIIRKNRNSVAIIRDNDSEDDLKALGKDLFSYFGLGCRNVSKVFIPKGFDFDHLFKAIYDYKTVVEHNKYANNYEYNRTVYLMGEEKLLDNGFLLLKEDKGLSSPVGTLFYEEYESEEQLKDRLRMDKDNIQCIVGKAEIPFGHSQQPELWDYADGIDTLKFLSSINAQIEQ